MSGYIGKSQSGILANPSNNTVETSDIQDNAVTPAKLSTGAPEWTSGGNVGIGTSSPSASLTVGNPTASAVSFVTNPVASFGGGIAFDAGSGTNVDLINYRTTSMVFGTGGAERMRIDSSGRVTMPYQPMFNATNGNAGNPTAWSTTHSNVGNHFNGTYFTAPVAGAYIFEVTSGSSSSYGVDIFLNNSTIRRLEHVSPPGFSWNTVSVIVRMAANDFVHVGVFTGSPAQNSPYGGFSGYLLG